ncbi:ABC transporter permease subunit [Lichenicola cladoniae]|uniref:ABC transporter permease subunit n=2 Tax=Lichenicola cladoniae TaxID=1484109 RepID=A0A6M8HPG7_9PROT|nr:ABC transporter permease subunit [Lichenicola cladoniae]NPD68320.1 ABC transporter permease subunit [Acetobacteraceae bacterium]QKE90177.1 ABC transporter permease subunit [Lichenicola cladoniae]
MLPMRFAAMRVPANASIETKPNLFDFVAILVMLGLATAIGSVARHTLGPLPAPDASTIHLNAAYLPGYAVRTTLRMFAALVASLLFTFTYPVWAAKSRRAGALLVPILDILQSVPILGFLTFTYVFFMSLFPGRVLGAELAVIFTIFTSQAWNMAFSMYQSLKTVPADLEEVSRGFGLSAWQRFWRLEVPYAMPGLVWNTMMSMSGGWFFIVASEAFSVGNTSVALPGIGSFIASAVAHRNIVAVFEAILTMLVVILLYDQLLFRPLVAWSARFRLETTPGAVAGDPWVLRLLRRTRLLNQTSRLFSDMLTSVGGLPLGRRPSAIKRRLVSRRIGDSLWFSLLGFVAVVAAWQVGIYAYANLSWPEIGHVMLLGIYTMIRVVTMILLATIVWVPIGVWLGLRPVWAARAQPVAQFMAAFPANLFYPIFVVAIVHYHLSSNIWLTPLMILGTQWYILFNVIAGTAAFPGDLLEAARNFQIGGWRWWVRVMLPGIFPYYVTGALTASGGAWNAAIASEVATWGNTTLTASGLGSYIFQATAAGATAKVGLGMVAMAFFVILFNRLVWRPMYSFANRRLTFS